MQDSTQKARLLLVDDHAFMRAGIRSIFGSDGSLEVVGEAEDGHEALTLCRELDPDLVLMDVSMPQMDGIEATRRMKAESPTTSVLILTAHADQDLLMEAVKAGAAGYILKNSEPRRVLGAVRSVLEGETPLDQELAMRLLRRIGEEVTERTAASARIPATKSGSSLPNPLTLRETEVLGHLSSGKTNRQIARELHVSVSTIKRHLERILPKLGVSDRTQAAVRAVELGVHAT